MRQVQADLIYPMEAPMMVMERQSRHDSRRREVDVAWREREGTCVRPHKRTTLESNGVGQVRWWETDRGRRERVFVGLKAGKVS